MDEFRLTIPSRLKERMQYDKLAGDVPRILILESGYWLDAACVQAGRLMGWDVRTVPVPLEGSLSRDNMAEMLYTLVDMRPDFVLTINLGGMDVGGVFARLFEDLELPYVTWFVDDPRTIVMDQALYGSPFAVALTWERSYLPYLQQSSFAAVHYMPLAVDPVIFQPPASDLPTIPPAFVGNSMTVPAQKEWEWVNQNLTLANAIDSAFENKRVNRETFAHGLEALLPEFLLSELDADEKRHAEILFFVEGTRRLRHELVGQWIQEDVSVRGDDEWRLLTPQAGAALNYTHDLARFYAQCEVNLNITSIQMATAVNQRVFDCPAAGGFLLTDAQADLKDLFEVDREIACYNSMEESVEMIAWYRARPAVRREIAARAQARILNEHTYAHRLRAMVEILRTLYA